MAPDLMATKYETRRCRWMETNTSFILENTNLASGWLKILYPQLNVLCLTNTARLFWNPVVISVSLSSKERKDKQVMGPYQRKVEALDIKTVATYVPETTHVVATKRNTAAGLQALINERYIVTNSYLDAILEAASTLKATEEGSAGDGSREGGEVLRSRLETDFDANWPNPEDYLPVYSGEPKDREPWRFRPNEKRNSLFEGYTFIFCEKTQYDNFLGPITNAHGKLERCELKPHQTTAEDLVNFVKKVGQGSRPVMVRFRGKKDAEWENQLSTDVQEMYVPNKPVRKPKGLR